MAGYQDKIILSSKLVSHDDSLMNDQDLATLLKNLESDRVERKASISDRGKLREAICAFANDLPNHQKPGVLFIGVNNDGSCANLPITDQLLLTLSDMRSDGNILPFPNLVVQKRTIAGCELAVVLVEPSNAPPVRYNGRVCIRVGPRRGTATQQEEIRLSERITWFRDRIEIQNPGGPFGQVNCDNFGQPGITDYRNPNLAEVMKNMGYVQRFGLGISLAKKELAKNGNPPPEFLVNHAHVLAIVRRHP